jgi:chaperonin cofactor prefoldin
MNHLTIEKHRVKQMERKIKKLDTELEKIKKALWTADGFNQCILFCRKNQASFRVKRLRSEVKHLKVRIKEETAALEKAKITQA